MSAFGSSSLRLYSTADLAGLEWASALVACLAIAVGFARGVGLGPGLLAAFITIAVEEAARLTECAGGSERTVLGLGGYGDLLASIAQTERPEVLLGEALARGETLEQALAEAGHRVEAVELAEVIASWAEARGLAAPILAALARQIPHGKSKRRAGERPDDGRVMGGGQRKRATSAAWSESIVIASASVFPGWPWSRRAALRKRAISRRSKRAEVASTWST